MIDDPLIPKRKAGCLCGLRNPFCPLHHVRCACGQPMHRDTEGRERHNLDGSYTGPCTQEAHGPIR